MARSQGGKGGREEKEEEEEEEEKEKEEEEEEEEEARGEEGETRMRTKNKRRTGLATIFHNVLSAQRPVLRKKTQLERRQWPRRTR